VKELKTQTPSPDVQVIVDKKGSVSVHGVAGVMVVNGILSQWIFDHNKANHDFYVEECFVIPWMYPYLEPHGWIMKLNKEPIQELDPAVVTQDRRFWDALAKELLADPHFRDNDEGRKMIGKLRSAIGGLYAYRHLTTDAEAAFKQALELYPAGSEPSFRLASLYAGQSRFDDAIGVLDQLQSRTTDADHRQHTASAIEQLRELKRKAEGKKASTSPPAP
jgi:tetratricopeptide (TPR) repeat protein